MARKHCLSRLSQRGQSTSEFLIAMVVCVPLYLAVDYAGKYGDLQQSAVQASRYAAFQRVLEPTTSKLSDDKIKDQTKARFFLDGDRNGGKLNSDDTVSGLTDDDGQPVLWRDKANSALLASPAQVDVKFGSVDMAPPGSVAWAIDGLAWTAGLEYNRQGRIATVELDLVNKLDMASDTPINLKIGAATAAAAGGWGSSGRDMTKRQAATIVPTSWVPPFITDIIDVAIGLFEDSGGPQFGCIKPDVVAPDRLEPFSGTEGC